MCHFLHVFTAAAVNVCLRCRAQQVCRNCRVPTELVEDHAAGDLICKARRVCACGLARACVP
jgi:hypothetical protein